MAAKDSRDLTLTRVYDAPVKAVWDAWTDPEQTAKWWGPRGFTITTHSKDLRPGGHWHYTMHGPDGTDYPNWTVYHEVDPGKRLVYDHGGYEDRPPLFQVRVTFEAIGKKQTRMEMTMTCPTPEAAAQTKKIIKQASGHSTWDRLAEYLASEDVFVINRTFETPAEEVFHMWTNPAAVARWMGPMGMRMEFTQSEIAVGRTTFYRMAYESGLVTYGQTEYLEIEVPRQITYVQMFCDENGAPAKHPHLPAWPAKLKAHVNFSSEADGQTRITLVWRPVGETSEDERRAFREMRAQMTKGWNEAFDKLDSQLPVAPTV